MKKLFLPFLFACLAELVAGQADTTFAASVGGRTILLTDTQLRALMRDRRVDTVFIRINPLHADTTLPLANTVLRADLWNVPAHMSGWRIKRVDFSVYALGQTGQNYTVRAHRLNAARSGTSNFGSTIINDTAGAGTNVDQAVATNEIYCANVETMSGGSPPKGLAVTFMVIRP
jgi:hypothetical protein